MTPREFRALRLRLGLTQRQVAEAMGVRPNTVWRWENGSLPRIAALALRGIQADAKSKPRR